MSARLLAFSVLLVLLASMLYVDAATVYNGYTTSRSGYATGHECSNRASFGTVDGFFSRTVGCCMCDDPNGPCYGCMKSGDCSSRDNLCGSAKKHRTREPVIFWGIIFAAIAIVAGLCWCCCTCVAQEIATSSGTTLATSEPVHTTQPGYVRSDAAIEMQVINNLQEQSADGQLQPTTLDY